MQNLTDIFSKPPGDFSSGVREVTLVRGATALDVRVGDNLTSDADGKAVLQVPAGVTTYRENQTRNYTLGIALTAHSWGVLQVPAGVTTYRENQARNYALGGGFCNENGQNLTLDIFSNRQEVCF
jgi:hypothetical protein